MFESSDQVLDLPSTDLRGRKVEGGLVCEGGMRRREPGPHLLEISLEELKCEADDTGKADQPIRFLRIEPLRFPAPRECSGRDLKEVGHAGGREIENSAKPLERSVRKALTNPGVQLGCVIGTQPEEGHMSVRMVWIASDLTPEAINSLGTRSLCDAHVDLLVSGHMAYDNLPYA